MRMSERSLDQILRDFNNAGAGEEIKQGAIVSIWLPEDYRVRYAKIQEMSHRRFSATLRQLIMAAIEMAESKAKT